MEFLSEFICPLCRGKLEKDERALLCSVCQHRFNLIEGIATFSRKQTKLTKDADQRVRAYGDSPFIYDTAKNKITPLLVRYNFYLRRRAFKRLINIKNKLILDVGCGSGNATDFLLKDNNMYAMDVSIEMLKIARSKGFRCLFNSAVEKLPFAENFFDAILCLGVLPLFNKKEISDMMNEFRRVLKDKGLLFISSPSDSFLRLRRKLKDKTQRKNMYPFKEFFVLIQDWAKINSILYLYSPWPKFTLRREPASSHFSTAWVAELELK